MGSTFFSLHYHIIFSTKNRQPLIRAGWKPRLHSYMGGIIRGMNGVAEIAGGVDDHVHILASLRPVHRIADVLRDLKKESTNWVKENFDRGFAWQEGYAAFSVSPSATEPVRVYIANQETHHGKHSFVGELRELLSKAGIEYDEKYFYDLTLLHPSGVRKLLKMTGGLRSASTSGYFPATLRVA